jgi:Putative transposase/Transposase zinc-binding domain
MCVSSTAIVPSLRSQEPNSRATIQRILYDNWRAFAAQSPQPIFAHRAAYLLAHCKTALMGGHVERCKHGHVEKVHYNSCRHRCCPGCSAAPRKAWLDKQQAKMLDTSAMQVVFTLPSDLAKLWRMNKQQIADVLFNSSKESLLKLLADPQFLGALPGLLGALHTWSQTLSAHPHVHYIVTFGGLASDGTWKTPTRDCLLPRHVLMSMFRGKFLSRVRKLVSSDKLAMPEGWTKSKCLSLLNQLGRAPWNVKLLERYAHAKGVTLYLARYLRGGPIGNSRIVSYSKGEVTFRYLDRKNPSNPQTKEMTLPVNKFLERWAQHIPPGKMHTIRVYGLYSASHKRKLEQARAQLGKPIASEPVSNPEDKSAIDQEETKQKRCPICNESLEVETLEFDEAVRPWNVYRAKRISRCERSPPSVEELSIA